VNDKRIVQGKQPLTAKQANALVTEQHEAGNVDLDIMAFLLDAPNPIETTKR